jgi:hypothetical protein
MTTITFDTLTKQQQLNMQDIYQLLDKLREFSNKMNANLLNYLFGCDKTAIMLMGRFVTVNKRDVLQWFVSLTLDQKGIVLSNIYYNDELYIHCY